MALTLHKAKVSTAGRSSKPDWPQMRSFPEKLLRKVRDCSFRSQGSDGLQLGQLRQKKSKWVLRTEDLLPVEESE